MSVRREGAPVRKVSPARLRSPDVLGPRAIRVRSLTKTYVLPAEQVTTVKAIATKPLARRPARCLEALRDVSFEVRRGEFLGVLGKNGSGKSTLLRCLAGIYVPDAGTIEVEGRLVPFIELGVGFDPELPAFDNAVQNAVLFGLERREAEGRFDEMLEFAELRPFAGLKLKNYSSGMAVRLAFAVAAHVDADILLCDEVLAVGDAGFRERCFEHFERMLAAGKTIVLVTHDVEVVRERCDRVLLLHRGRVAGLGDPDEVAARYEELAAESLSEPGPPPTPERLRPRRLSRGPVLGLPSVLRPRARRFTTVTRMLATTDFKLKYLDATLSYLWALLRPAIFFAVLLVVFGGVASFQRGVAHYAAYLLLGVALWTFFIQSTSAALHSLRLRAPLLRKLPFPRLAVPLATVLAASFDLVLNLGVALVFLLASGLTPRLAWLELVPIVALVAVLTTGLSLLLSTLFVRHRDIDQLWSVAAQAIFFLTPVFYAITHVSTPYRRVLLLANPLAAALTQARHALIEPAAPTAAQVAGGAGFLALPIGIAVGILVLGAWAFRRESPRAAELV